MSNKVKILFGFFLLFLAVSWAAVRVNNEAIWNSTLDNSCVGCTTAAAGNFTTLIFSHGLTNYLAFNGGTPTTGLGNAGYTGYNTGTANEMDFVSANNGSATAFYWYYYLGTSLTRMMFTDTSGALHNTNGFVGTLTGNSATSTLATTANALASTSTCTAQRMASGINTTGVAQGCSPQTLYGSTASVCTTPNGAGSPSNTCTTNVPWLNGSFTSGSYYAVCTGDNASGSVAPFIYITAKTTTYVTVSMMSGSASQANAATYSQIDCMGMQP
jgi:hypothetical protein